MRKLPAALLPVGIFLVTCAAFWPALQGGFNWDDDINLVTNPRYRGFDTDQIGWMFTNTLMGHYMPFTWLTFALDHSLGRMDPWGYHLVSLLLHAVNAVLVYWVARRLLTAARELAVETAADIRTGAALAALLFALHPQRAESVAWISDRATLLCAAFYSSRSWPTCARSAPDNAPRSVGRRLAWPRGGAPVKDGHDLPTAPDLDALQANRWLSAVEPAVRALAGAVVAAWARSQGAEFSDYGGYGIAARVGLIAYSVCFYPLKLVWPADLSPLYEVPSQVSLLDGRFLVPLLVMLAVTGVLLALRRRAPAALAAWAHAAAFVAPVSGVALGHPDVADRYAISPRSASSSWRATGSCACSSSTGPAGCGARPWRWRAPGSC
jgi:hypothetical protein